MLFLPYCDISLTASDNFPSRTPIIDCTVVTEKRVYRLYIITLSRVPYVICIPDNVVFSLSFKVTLKLFTEELHSKHKH